jgi:outer membrane protein assembly factor BamA
MYWLWVENNSRKQMKPPLSNSLAFGLFSSLLFALPCITSTQTPPRSGASMQSMPPSAYKLIAVKVIGSKRFTQEEVAASSGLPVGTIFHEEDFKKAARQLGESGAFNNVSFTYSYSAAGTKLEFQVADADRFVPARFTDFVWFTDDELRQKVHGRVPLFKGELPTSGRLPEQVSDVLQAMLVENAIPGHVEYVRTADKADRVEGIDYAVSGVSIRIHRLEFPGANANDASLFKAAAEKLSDREYSRTLVNDFAERVLLPTYHEHGYLKATCPPPQLKVVTLSDTEADIHGTKPTFVDVTFPLTPGPQYRLTRWEWSGNKEISTATLDPLLHIKEGQTANTVQLEDDLRTVRELYASRGHVTAAIKAAAAFDDAAGTVAFQLNVDEGPVYRMGELEFRGIDNNLTARLRAAWKLRPGDVYDASYLKQFLPEARKLLPPTLDWQVTPHVTALSRDKTVDVDLQYTAKAPQ